MEGWLGERAGQDGRPPKSWANQQAPENRCAPGAPEMLNYMRVNAGHIVAAAKRMVKGS